MRKIFWTGLLFLLILMSCATENSVVRQRKKVVCYREWMANVMPAISVPEGFEAIHETIVSELPVNVYKPFSVDLEQGREYLFSANVLPNNELLRLYLVKADDVAEMGERINAGVFLIKTVDQAPQVKYTAKDGGQYYVLLQTHLSDCADKVLVSMVVAESKEKNK